MKKIFLFIFVTFFRLSVFAAEYIDTFRSEIVVNSDATLTVTETITVYPEQKNIKRGIFRYLPINKGQQYRILSVKKDGHNEPFVVSRSKKFSNIRIGNKDVLLPIGRPVTYEIRYIAKYTGIKYYDDYDEVYWNVTGEWKIPINQTTAKVILPGGASFIQQASYRGKAGSKTPAVYYDNNIFTADMLKPKEQLTVAVGFTKGYVSVIHPPKTEKERLETHTRDIINSMIILGGLLIYFFIMWKRHGRDIYHKTAMVEYEAPRDFSPSQVYLWKHSGFAPRSNLITLHFLQMVQSGYITIERKNFSNNLTPVYFVVKTGKEPQTPDEVEYEKSMPKVLILDGEYNKAFAQYTDCFKLKEKTIFTQNCKLNTDMITKGLVLFALLIFFTPRLFGWTLFLIIFTIFLSGMSLFVRKFPVILLFPFFWLISVLHVGFILQPIVVAISVLVLGPKFQKLILQPTREGADNIAHIQGLELFLKTLDIKTPSDFTQEKAEELYPYAVALDLTQNWENRFRSMIGDSIINKAIYDTQFRNGMYRTVSHSSYNPAQSGRRGSGSSGGGSSGGGGGGGGGGGW